MPNISETDKANIQDLYTKKLIDQKTYELYFPPVPVTASYDTRTLTGKLAYDLQPVKIASFSIKFIIVAVIITALAFGGMYAYGVYKGKLKKPATIELNYGKEIMIDLGKGLFLHIQKDGKVHVQDNKDDAKAKIVKVIKVGDIEQLRKELRPYGLDLIPFATVGGSLGESKTGFEGGLGVQFAHWYKVNANAFITNLGAYLGLGYRITDNFDIMAGFGKGWKGDNRVGLFGKFKF